MQIAPFSRSAIAIMLAVFTNVVAAKEVTENVPSVRLVTKENCRPSKYTQGKCSNVELPDGSFQKLLSRESIGLAVQFDAADMADFEFEFKISKDLGGSFFVSEGVSKRDRRARATLVGFNGMMIGDFRDQNGKLFRLKPQPKMPYMLEEVPKLKAAPRRVFSVVGRPSPRISTPSDNLTCSDTGTESTDGLIVIDTLVAFTGEVRESNFGDSDVVKARIRQAIYETNESFSESGIGIRLNLLDSIETEFKEKLNNPSDPNNDPDNYELLLGLLGGEDAGAPPGRNFSKVREERDRKGADIVILVVSDNSGGAGDAMGFRPEDGKEMAFAIIHDRDLTGSYLFAHEIGHLLGAHHNVAITGESSATPPDNVGIFQPTGSTGGEGEICNGGWQTIMSQAQTDECENCITVRRWSNPEVTFCGKATGENGVANNKPGLLTNARIVANYHCRTER